jgi:methionyl-tRNA formyltransferase
MHTFLWCLNTEKGLDVLNFLIKTNITDISVVCSYPEWNVQKNFGNFIEQRCHDNDIPYISWNELKQDYKKYIAKYKISGIIVIGWQYLLPIELNAYLPDKIIIFHDSLLPKYRGFCPTATAILKGDEHLGISILYASEEMDVGELILQKSVEINDTVYIEDAIKIISKLYCDCAKELIDLVQSNKIKEQKQDETSATYCIWRNPEDNEINWDSSARDIFNLIRASGYPYFGAYTSLQNDLIRVWEATLPDYDINFEIRDTGKIWKIENGKPIIICKNGLLKIIRATYEDGKNVIPLEKFRLRFGRPK